MVSDARSEHKGGRISRRSLLAAGAGASVLVAMPDLLFAAPARAQTAPDARFFLYGTTGPGTLPALHGWRSPAGLGLSAPTPSMVASDLAADPVKSPDGSTVAVPTVRMTSSGVAVTLALVGTDAAAVTSSATLELPGVPQDAMVLVRPVFATGTQTIAVVLAISEPTYGGMFTKVSTTGESMEVRAMAWTTHHRLAYLDRTSLTFTGPHDLADAPSLAWTDAAADATHLYLWTMKEPAASGVTKADIVAGYSPPRLVVYPLGSGKPSLSLRSPGAWPCGHIGRVLPTAEVIRLVEGRDLEVFSPKTGELTRVTIERLDVQTAKPGVTNIHHRPDGTLLVANAAMGRAVMVEPAASFATTRVIDFPRPAIPLGGSEAKTALSPDGNVLFTLGPADVGGLSSYDLSTGALISSFSNGAHYSGVHARPGGSLLTLDGDGSSSQLSFFDQSLNLLGTSATTMHVAEVF